MPDDSSQYPTFTHVRSIFVERTNEDKEMEIGQLLIELAKLKWEEHLKRITARDINGHEHACEQFNTSSSYTCLQLDYGFSFLPNPTNPHTPAAAFNTVA